jgi:hypothetical protein
MRLRIRHRVVLSAVLVAVTAATTTGVAAPAGAAAARPTISAPSTTTGYSTVRITGTATPGATVALYESAYVFHDLKPAIDWADTGDEIAVKASAKGTYQIDRWVDTGFLFAVKVDGVMSATITVRVRLVPILSVTSTKAGTVTARFSATPAQPWIPVQIQRKNADGTWKVVARGYTEDPGTFSATVTKQTSKKTYTYRAWAGGDTESALLAAYSTAHNVRIK